MRVFDSVWGPKYIGYMIGAYLRRMAYTLELIVRASGADIRWRLVVALILASYPGRMRKQSGKAGELLDWAIVRLLRGRILPLNGVKYCLTDEESLYILAPRNEAWMWSYLNPKGGDTLIDVGAHIGKYALWGARMVGERGRVIALEPYQVNYDALVSGISENGFRNIIALKYAAWHEDMVLRLFLSVSSGGSVKVNSGFGYSQVSARSLDSITKDLGVTHVDWVKIDAEGAEFEILCGSVHLLSRDAPKVIMEVSRSDASRVDDFMKQLGYSGIPIHETPVYLYMYYLQ